MKESATLLLITLAALGQQTQNQYEPPNGEGAGQKLLAQFSGDWDVVKSFFPMNGKPIVTTGTAKQYMVQDGKNIILWATPLDPDRPGRKTVTRAHLEEDGRLLLHRHFAIDDKDQERMFIELRMTRR